MRFRAASFGLMWNFGTKGPLAVTAFDSYGNVLHRTFEVQISEAAPVEEETTSEPEPVIEPEPVQEPEPEPVIEPAPEPVIEPEPEPEVQPQPEVEPVVEQPIAVEQPVADELPAVEEQPAAPVEETPAETTESSPLGDEFGFFFRFEDIPEKEEEPEEGGEISVGEDSDPDSIRFVQQMLSAVGLFDEDDINGRYDEATTKAVRRFQSWVNDVRGKGTLPVNGKVDDLTRQYLEYAFEHKLRAEPEETWCTTGMLTTLTRTKVSGAEE